ncbi:MAG TPA: hypothetical protein VHH34_14255 [Pseudonocardiaceae bacterium]|nr:hypothetical protein [Pseudonocardiaceae bacterium]
MTLLKRSHQGQLPGIDYSIIDFASTAADPRQIQQRTAAWLDSAEMANLLEHFGYTLTATGLRDRLK